MESMKKVRADELVVRLGLAESRNQAQRLILAGQVQTLSGSAVEKASQVFPADAQLLLKHLPRYVGRGGEKLEGFFFAHYYDLHNKNTLDIGASTGGFTDFLLQNGVNSVVCLDVGHGQLHYKLRSDSRVTNLEKINARYDFSSQLPRQSFDVIVMDLAFISLRKILPNIWPLLAENGLLVSLIKPQFEAKKDEVDRCRGVIEDQFIHQRICKEIRDFALQMLPGVHVMAEMPSPIRGGDGNCEFFIGLEKRSK